MITVREVTLRRGTKVVLEGAGFVLNPGEKVGLVGRNGAGKSSLFSLMAGRLHADRGDVEMPPRWVMSEVAQHMPETEQGATDFVLEGDAPLVRAQAMLAEAEASEDGHAIADAHVALQDAGAFDARSRAQAMLLGLGFAIGQLDAPVNSFSGGWRMRLQLARALMGPADLLLLDEPTNHLDLDALVWLEAWLKRLPATMIVISHDREFLDAVTGVTLHVDEGRVLRYGGNYTAFESMRAERILQAQQAFAKQQERINHLQRFIDRFKAKASKARQAQSRVKALARMEKLAPLLTAGDFQFEFREPPSIPNPMLALRGTVCGYGTTPIVQGVERTVMAGQRIGILGANGQGKSTLVKTIAHMLPALGGEMVEGKGLAIGYFAQQEMDLLSEDDTPLQRMVRLAREVSPQAREQELRNFLGQFSFVGEMVHQRVGTLSGGERARLVLATLVWQRPNLLLLDEPTNHLDLTTREALSMALNEFEGTVLLVSHDRALLRETCDEFWLVTRGGVQPFDGDLDDYQAWLLDVSRAVQRGQPAPEPPRSFFVPAERAGAGPHPSPLPQAGEGAERRTRSELRDSAAGREQGLAPSPAPRERAGVRAAASRDDRQAGKAARAALAHQTRPLRQEITRLDERLGKLGAEKAEVEAALAAPGQPADTYADLGRRLAHVGAEIAMLEERWLEVSTELESLKAE